MALREVLKFPDKRLRLVSKPISEVTDEIRELASDMLEVMYDEPGIGLAAPQVAEPVRLIVVDTEWNTEDGERNPLVLVNPEILERSGQITWTEGCLSVPDFEADVEMVISGINDGNRQFGMRLLQLPDVIKGYGHIKAGNIQRYRASRIQLISKFQQPELTLVVNQ